jgi:hypothetical protein
MKCNPPVDQTQPVLPASWDPDEPTTVVFKAFRCPEDLNLLRKRDGLPPVVAEVHEEVPANNYVKFKVEGASRGKGFRCTLGVEIEGSDVDTYDLEWDGTPDEWYDVYGDILPYITCCNDFRTALKAVGLE